MNSITISKDTAQTIQADLVHTGQALNAVSLLLDEISAGSKDKAHEISWTHSLVRMIAKQVEQTEEDFRSAIK